MCNLQSAFHYVIQAADVWNMFVKCKQKCFTSVSLDEVEKKCYDAFNYGRREEALRLLKQVKDPHTVKSKNNFTILHCAAYHGWLDVVKDLINDHQFVPDCKDNDGNTPLSKARSNGKQFVVEYLETAIGLGAFVVYYCLHVHVCT